MLRLAGSIALAGLTLASYCAATDQASPPHEERLVNLYREFSDTVVKVKVAVKTVDENGKDKVALTVQSGFYIDDKGTVLTNALPMQEGPRVRIEKDGVQLLAIPIASDPRANLALIQVAKPPSKIHFIDIEQASEQPQIGSLAYAITSPLDLDPTPKMGLVTGRESSFSDIIFPFTYTRVSISSGPAEGGSPIFNSKGEFIGISVASLPEVDSSYIVPRKALLLAIKRLRKKDGNIHPIVRAKIVERVDPTSLERNIIVDEVTPQSAAAGSGLKPGDQILSIDGEPLTSIDDWRDRVFFSDNASFVSLTIRRDSSEKQIALLLETE